MADEIQTTGAMRGRVRLIVGDGLKVEVAAADRRMGGTVAYMCGNRRGAVMMMTMVAMLTGMGCATDDRRHHKRK